MTPLTYLRFWHEILSDGLITLLIEIFIVIWFGSTYLPPPYNFWIRFLIWRYTLLILIWMRGRIFHDYFFGLDPLFFTFSIIKLEFKQYSSS